MRTVRTAVLTSLLLAASLPCLAQPSNNGSGQPPVTTPSITLPLADAPTPVASANVAIVGNPGHRTVSYWIVTNSLIGSSTPAGPFSVIMAPDAYSATGTIAGATITWPAVPNAVSYDVLRNLDGKQPSGACNCAVATGLTTTSFSDTVETRLSYTVNPVNAAAYAVTLTNTSDGAGKASMKANGTQVGGTSCTGQGASQVCSTATLSATRAATYPGIVGTLPNFLGGSMAGKHIFYVGNSTVWNAAPYYDQICTSISDARSPLYGMNPCRTGLSTLASDGVSTVTAVFTSSVAGYYTVGELITFLPGNPVLNTFQGTCKVATISGTTLTCNNWVPITGGIPGATSATSAMSSYVSDSILMFGWNGATSPYILSAMAPYWPLVQPGDLVEIRGPLINDVRQGACNLACATSNIAALEAAVLAAIPAAADVYWKTENSLLTTDPTGSGYVTPLASSAAYSQIIHDAVWNQVPGSRSNVAAVDTQALLYGTNHATFLLPGYAQCMNDILHPGPGCTSREAVLDVSVFAQMKATAGTDKPPLYDVNDYLGIVEAVKKQAGYSPIRAATAQIASWASCWTYYSECVFDSNLYTPIAAGVAIDAPSTGDGYLDFSWPGGAVTQIKSGDLVWYGGNVFQIPGSAALYTDGTGSRIAGLGGALPPANVTSGQNVVVFRAKTVDPLDVPYLLAPNVYTHHHPVGFQAGTNWARFYYTDAAQTWGTNYTSTDVIVLTGGYLFPLSNCTGGFIQITTYVQCNGTGAWSVYNGLAGNDWGTGPMETFINGILVSGTPTNGQVQAYNSTTGFYSPTTMSTPTIAPQVVTGANDPASASTSCGAITVATQTLTFSFPTGITGCVVSTNLPSGGTADFWYQTTTTSGNTLTVQRVCSHDDAGVGGSFNAVTRPVAMCAGN